MVPAWAVIAAGTITAVAAWLWGKASGIAHSERLIERLDHFGRLGGVDKETGRGAAGGGPDPDE